MNQKPTWATGRNPAIALQDEAQLRRHRPTRLLQWRKTEDEVPSSTEKGPL